LSFGRRLQSERARLGLSQLAFAELGGVKRSSQFLYERDSRHPDVEYLLRIQGAGVDVGFLLGGDRAAALSSDPRITEAQALSAFRAVEEFTRKHEGQGVSAQERERLFSFLCSTLASATDSDGGLPTQLAERWAG
jgi:transcriptional regulator with XRE-family HTH domain